VTNDELITVLWGRGTGRNQKNLRVLLAMARRKLKARREPFEIINEHGRGYRMVSTGEGGKAAIPEEKGWVDC
jgi:DNA-binding winged helix-turn-helix (wHTH) protein